MEALLNMLKNTEEMYERLGNKDVEAAVKNVTGIVRMFVEENRPVVNSDYNTLLGALKEELADHNKDLDWAKNKTTMPGEAIRFIEGKIWGVNQCLLITERFIKERT